jgi:DNA polymerase (family 10)
LPRHRIAALLRQAGQSLLLQKESRYRAAAYEAGADALDALSGDFERLVAEDRLTEVRGIGRSLAATISDLATTGRSATLERILEVFPPGVLELAAARLPGLTLRRIRLLQDNLGITSLEELRAAVMSGVIGSLKGFGPKMLVKLRQAMDSSSGVTGTAVGSTPATRSVLVDVIDWGDRLLAYLRSTPLVIRAEVAGSVRRWVETVGDLNLIVASAHADQVLGAFLEHPAISRVVDRGETRCRTMLTDGTAVTLEVVPPSRFPAAWMRATGSVAHWRRLEARARSAGVNGLADLEAVDEGEVYGRLGLPFIPPELREDAGELEAAASGDRFEDLITAADIRGVVHCHTVFSDGRHTVAQMAAAAAKMGMAYITITDHSPNASYAGGVPEDRLPEQWQEIAAAQATTDVRILRGTEADILRDGALDYPMPILRSLDVVIASIHERYRLDGPAMTERLVRAMGQPLFKIWGHALGRLLTKRDPISCDVERVLDVVAQSPAAIEVNGSPYRLDLPAAWIRSARRRGIKFVISTDAHSMKELQNLRFGVAEARRGGLRKRDVLNTLSADEFQAAVRPRVGLD